MASANQSEEAAASQGAPIKTSTIVRNPAHQPKMKQKVVLRSKKSGRQTVDSHFRRSLGFETQIQPIMKKRPSSMIEHSEVIFKCNKSQSFDKNVKEKVYNGNLCA